MMPLTPLHKRTTSSLMKAITRSHMKLIITLYPSSIAGNHIQCRRSSRWQMWHNIPTYSRGAVHFASIDI